MTEKESIGKIIKQSLRLELAIRYVWESAKGWTIASIVLLVVQGLLPLITLYLMKLIVDAVTEGLASADKKAAFSHVAVLIAFAALVALITALCRSSANFVSEAQSQVISDHMNDVIHAKSIEVDLEYYESSQYYDTLHRAQQEAPYRPAHIVNNLVHLGQNGLSLLAMVGLLLSFHWIIAVILFITVIPGLLVRLKFAGKMFRLQCEWTQAERQAAYFNWLLTGDTHAKEVRLFGLGSLLMDRFSKLRKQIRRERLGMITRRSSAEFAAQTIAISAIFGAFAFVAYRAIQGTITLGDLVMYYGAFQRGQSFLQDMLRSL
ncbi:ABC transporter transmembrane domain-containing protein, partial [Acidobacteriota bacterium]